MVVSPQGRWFAPPPLIKAQTGEAALFIMLAAPAGACWWRLRLRIGSPSLGAPRLSPPDTILGIHPPALLPLLEAAAGFPFASCSPHKAGAALNFYQAVEGEVRTLPGTLQAYEHREPGGPDKAWRDLSSAWRKAAKGTAEEAPEQPAPPPGEPPAAGPRPGAPAGGGAPLHTLVMLAAVLEEGAPLRPGSYGVQVKLDGTRLLAHCPLGSVAALTRGGEPARVIELFAPSLRLLAGALPPGAVLDGELYLHRDPRTGKRASIGDINGLRSGYKAPDLGLAPHVEYHVFTWFVPGSPAPFAERQELLAAAFAATEAERAAAQITWDGPSGSGCRPANPVVMVQTTYVTIGADGAGMDALRELRAGFLAQGYEGGMIYAAQAPYTPGRKKAALMKSKPREKDWFPLLGAHQEKGEKNRAVVRYDDGGVTCVSSGRFTHAERTALAALPEEWFLGKWALISYLARHPNGPDGSRGGLREPVVEYIADAPEGGKVAL